MTQLNDAEHSSAPACFGRRQDLLALSPCVLFWGAFVVRSNLSYGGARTFTLFDDSMISMRYAKTLASGGGLVWYPGAPRVEGYSNFLWTLIMAVPHLIGFGGPGTSLLIICLGALCVALTALLAAAIVRLLGASQPATPVLAVLVCSLCFPLLFWTLRGMEVGFLTLLTMVAVFLALRLTGSEAETGPRNGALAALAVVFAVGLLTRDDFAVIVAAVTIWLAVTLRGSKRRNVLAILLTTSAAVVAGHLVFRITYYGDPLPNTYTLKMTGVSMATRLSRGLGVAMTNVLTAFLAPGVVIAVATLRVALLRIAGVRLMLLVVLATFGYSTWVGGDAWEGIQMANRFIVPALVMWMVVCVVAADRLASAPSTGWSRARYRLILVYAAFAFVGPLASPLVPTWPYWAITLPGAGEIIPRVVIICVVLLGAAFIGICWARPEANMQRQRLVALVILSMSAVLAAAAYPAYQTLVAGGLGTHDDQRAIAFGHLLKELTKPRANIAVEWAGALAYYADRPTTDLLGKNDAAIARVTPSGQFYPGHNKWDYGYSIGKLRPDLIAQLGQASRFDLHKIREWGYVPVAPRVKTPFLWNSVRVNRHAVLLARTDSTRLHWALLQRRSW